MGIIATSIADRFNIIQLANIYIVGLTGIDRILLHTNLAVILFFMLNLIHGFILSNVLSSPGKQHSGVTSFCVALEFLLSNYRSVE